MRFLSPEDVKGTGLLTFDYKKKDDDIWLFMPALRKTRRIISTEKAKNFMGSEFSYSDMSPPVLDDFNYKRLADEKCGEEDCWKVEMIPANEKAAEENGFSKKATLGDNIDLHQIAEKYEIAGGTIINVIQHSSLKALGRNSNEIQLQDIITGIKREYHKNRRTL